MADLVVDAVAKFHGRHAVLRDVDLKVASGSLLAILGVSGSGKTTLLRLIAGFDTVDGGSIAIGGAVMASRDCHVPPERRRIGYVPQNGALFPHLTVAQNIGLGVPKAARREAVARLLEQTGLSPDLARRMPAQLSGGQQQRVALARALAPEPRLVLLDEPFSALDPGLRAETAAAVVGILAKSGSTAVLVTHDRGEAFSLGTGIAILRAGRIAQSGTPEALYRNPADLDMARFLGEASVLPGVAQNCAVRCALGRLPVAGDGAFGEVEVLIRPEQLRLEPAGDAEAVRAAVAGVTYFGADALVSLRLAEGEVVVARILGQGLPRLGEAVRVRVEGAVVVFAKSCAMEAG